MGKTPKVPADAQSESRRIDSLIEDAISTEDWMRARLLIRKQLKQRPNDHFLLTRLGVTYYERHDYRKSLQYSLAAARIAPYCPLVLWDCACDFDMLEQNRAALELYRKLTKKNLRDLAFGPCGEGLVMARGILSDTYYRMGRIHERMGRIKRALAAYEKSLRWREERARSIYPRSEVAKRMKALAATARS